MKPSDDEVRAVLDRITHDLNNELGVIINYATLLERSLTDEGALADVGEILIAAREATELVRQLVSEVGRSEAT